MHAIMKQSQIEKINQNKTGFALSDYKSELVACTVCVPTRFIYIIGKQKVALNDRHTVRSLSHLATINVCELN